MAVVIPQVVTEDRASGAPIIEGATRFFGAEPQTGEGAYLTRSQSGTSTLLPFLYGLRRMKHLETNFYSTQILQIHLMELV